MKRFTSVMASFWICVFLIAAFPHSLFAADARISDLPSLTDLPSDSDVFPIVDVSDTGISSSGKTKKITPEKLMEYTSTAYPKTEAKLIAAIANASTPRVVLSADVTLSAPLTIPSGTTFTTIPGFVLTTTAANTLTFAAGSHLEDNGEQMFDASPGEVIGLSVATPEMFGASASPTDSATAMQCAIEAANTVELDAKTYLMNRYSGTRHTLSVVKSTNILGKGASQTVIQTTDTTGAIIDIGYDSTYVATAGVTISGIKFVGAADGTGSPGEVPSAIMLSAPTTATYSTPNVTDVIVRDCEFTVFCTAINALGAKRLTIENNYSHGNVYYAGLTAGGYGINYQTCYDVVIRNNRFLSTATDRHSIYGSIQVGNSEPWNVNAVIDGNIVDWSNVATSYVEACMAFRVHRGLVVTNNVMTGGYNGIYINTENGDSENIAISSNKLSGLLNHSTDEYNSIAVINALYNGSTNVYTFDGLVIDGNIVNSGNDYVHGMTVRHADNVVIANNAVTLTGTHTGALILGGVQYGTVTGNKWSLASGPYATAILVADHGAVARTSDYLTFGPQLITGWTKLFGTYGITTTRTIKHMYPRVARVTSNGAGTITVASDPYAILSAAPATDAQGAVISFTKGLVTASAIQTMMSTTNSGLGATTKRFSAGSEDATANTVDAKIEKFDGTGYLALGTNAQTLLITVME